MSRKTLVPALLVAVLTGTLGPAAAAGVRDRLWPTVAASATTAAPAAPAPVELLRAWDARRAEAWARGDPALLRPLYTRGSRAGRHDRGMLRAWATRGLVVRGMHTQLLSVRELAHTATSWTLQVTDRLVGGVAVGPELRRPLPRDEATTRTLRLRRVDGQWRVSSVRPEEVAPQPD